MAKATTTIRQALHYQPQHADSFAANHALFNPKTPNANVGHLPISQGMESVTGMASPKM